MTAAPGTRLGPYEITAKLGEGGMGEVWRATDTRLEREVAIKVLPSAFTADKERLARFEREAKLLAQLHHPNIASVFGLEESDGTRALVMELVEGEDLAQRIARGAIPVDEALAIAKQVAEALEAAHERGIVHRDLKPQNAKVCADGTVKVLDFGLAKAMEADGGASAAAALAQSPTLMNSPTLTGLHGTQLGVILGTAAYMAPEQARGKAVDRRADVWAFGAVLFEMLSGRRAFGGDDISDVLANVLKSEPDWSALPAATPPSVRRLLHRSLQKDPRKRLSSIADARLDLDEEAEPVSSPPRATRRARLGPWLAAGVAGAMLATAVAALLWPSAARRGSDEVLRLSVLAPPGSAFLPDSSGVAISPDGRQVAFVTGDVNRDERQLWVRSLDSQMARQLDDVGGTVLPFWSPDSRRLGYFSNGKLRTIAATGGRSEAVCDAPAPRGGAWSPSNLILFAPDASGPLYRIAASGGTATPATELDPTRGERGHRMPAFLHDGEHFVYAALPGRAGRFDVFVGSLKGGRREALGTMENAPVFAEPDWLLFSRQGILAAQRLDEQRRALVGEPISLGDEPTSFVDPAMSVTAGRTASASTGGRLAYFSAPSTNTVAVWLDTTGKRVGTLALPAGHYASATVSPDGTQAILVRNTSASESTLWLADLVRGGALPLSSGHGHNDSPVWSPDGTRVVFASDRDGAQDLFEKTVADAAPERPIYRSDVLFKFPAAWSSDGKWIVVTQLDVGTAQDLFVLAAGSGGKLQPYLRGPQREDAGPLSPDGRWLTVISPETGRTELFAQAFPTAGNKVQISEHGASRAWWRDDGRELLFADGERRSLWRVDVDTAGAKLRVGVPVELGALPPDILSLDAMPDRQRFLAIVPERSGPGSLTIVDNWQAALATPR